MRLVMFGGTFDPVHTGHTVAAGGLIACGKADRVLMIPAPDPPHKTNRSITPYAVRREMLELAIAAVPGAEISDIECERSGPSYTIDTLRALSERYPGDRILLAIGADSLADFHKWKNAARIAAEYEIVTYPRPGIHISAETLSRHWDEQTAHKLAESLLTDFPECNAASTRIRQCLRDGTQLPAGMLDERVYEYIVKNRIYL